MSVSHVMKLIIVPLGCVRVLVITLAKTLSARELKRYVELFTFYRPFKLFTLANLVICAMC